MNNVYRAYKAQLQQYAVVLEEEVRTIGALIEERNKLESAVLTGELPESEEARIDDEIEYVSALADLYNRMKEQQEKVDQLMERIAKNPVLPYWRR